MIDHLETCATCRRVRDKKLPFPWHERLHIAYEACQGLDYLHSLKPYIVHKDIKPANIFLGAGNIAKLGDIGLSVEVGKMDSKTK